MPDHLDCPPDIRRRRPRTPVGIPYATVEAVVAAIHGIGDDGRAALRARLHSLRRLDFPNGVSGSSGRHFNYDLADLIGVLAALELAEAYVPPAAAAAIVREGWPEIAGCALGGLRGSRGTGVAAVHPAALYQALGLAGSAPSDTLHVEYADLAPPTVDARTINIAAGKMASRALEELSRLDVRSSRLAQGQVADLDARFGDGEPLPRPDVNDGRLISDGPYWARARSLLGAIAGGNVAERDRRRATWQLGYLTRPAPIEAWKTRVEVHPNLDFGYAAAVASLAHHAGLRNGRIRLSGDDAARTLRRMTAVVGDPKVLAARLSAIAVTGERKAGDGTKGSGGRR